MHAAASAVRIAGGQRAAAALKKTLDRGVIDEHRILNYSHCSRLQGFSAFSFDIQPGYSNCGYTELEPSGADIGFQVFFSGVTLSTCWCWVSSDQRNQDDSRYPRTSFPIITGIIIQCIWTCLRCSGLRTAARSNQVRFKFSISPFQATPGRSD